ncbi:hypothetical protein CVT24_007969 [Panaeolus cyanescens]|uniref:Phospholipase D1 n=1 Tax=Panaeolus cyanescens TaxID=181874 RepID=A0A409YQS2_9AGAR|nr:hypothetical protein CVT24_007969 [Panaeolus cyanescens]
MSPLQQQTRLSGFCSLRGTPVCGGGAFSGLALLIVDKCPEEWVGGNGYFTAGAHRTVHGGLQDLQHLLGTPLSQEQLEKIDVEPYTSDQFKDDINRPGGNRSNKELIQTLVDQSRKAIGWLRERVGVPFVLSTHRQAYEVAGRIKFWGGMALAVEDGGKGLIATHQKRLKEAGVEIWTECRATQVLMSANSAEGVNGLEVEKKGDRMRLSTRCVVLAAGGFEANKSLRVKYLGEGWENAKVRGTPYNTGDGFYLATQVGGKLVGDWKGCHSTAWDANADANAGQRNLTNQYTKSGYPLGIMVNKHGKRFVDEGEDYRNYTYAKFGRRILEQPGGFAFQLWDGKVIGHLRKEEYGEGVVERIMGGTIEELATKLEEKGLEDKQQLLETLREYNEAVTAGIQQASESGLRLSWNPAIKDGLRTMGLEMDKTNWAQRIDEGPFMAVKVGCGITFTFGGVKIEPSTAGVICEEGNVIPGLYCTGEMVGDLFYDNYPGGSGLTAGAVFGMNAASTSQSFSQMPRFISPPDTPATRTGPPRSLSFAYSMPNSPSTIKHMNNFTEFQDQPPDSAWDDPDLSFSTAGAEFRSALDISSLQDRKGKRRERSDNTKNWPDDTWNPRKWFQDTPKEEKNPADFLGSPVSPAHPTVTDSPVEQLDLPSPMYTSEPESSTIPRSAKRGASAHESDPPNSAKTSVLRRAFSVPHSRSDGETSKEKDKSQSRRHSGERNPKWGRLRSLIPHIIQTQSTAVAEPSVIAPPTVNITDELITGGLSTLMLRLWFERDEKGNRRIPILFHRLRIRISDSIHPLQDKTIFRIECEYANAVRWVVYRELKDFFSLHTHYTVSNVYNRNVDKMPEFPKISLPIFKHWTREGRERGDRFSKAEYARMQRESLETYMINLIRAVMFHPSSNRLATFLEMSALFISLAQSGGIQHKAGYLRIESSGGSNSAFGRRSVGWRAKREARWCAVRESYLVVMEEPAKPVVWDVLLIDQDFEIQRPKRYYRQNLNNLLHHEKDGDEDANGVTPAHHSLHVPPTHLTTTDTDRRSVISSIKTRVSKIFHLDPSHTSQTGSSRKGGTSQSDSHRGNSMQEDDNDADHSDSVSSTNSSSSRSRPPTPVVDPSTNPDAFTSLQSRRLPRETDQEFEERQRREAAARVPDSSSDVSKHTFYIINSQMKLKVIAKNERQMLQFITAMQKAAQSCIYRYPHRFDSFAPIRTNVSAQWLVDGSGGVEPNDTDGQQHEKLCVIDQAIAFMGGLDLCFGRWDTAQHVLTDDVADGEHEIWPGKDYSNPRISDFHNLNKPEEDMYDRTKIPRMPWHDVAMQIVGQPARDLARHFVERWNYLLRIKNHSRVMPFLTPPPEFKSGELQQMGLTGTCELQICRSTGPWSMGTTKRVEQSIQNAYLKAIQLSEHFVYIENQFFITSTTVNDVKIENHIGDAIVHRIIRAHRDGTPWKCCVMIPLLPGFTFPVDHPDASAIRIILECQNLTISRGPNSIYGRLLKEGIDPNEYISVFSLRNWGKMRGEVLTTEQVYIHAKVCIVDDRLAIIGSANINERSQRGDRDSELAAVIRDTDMINSTMAGMPFKVGRFAHTLRVRLMQEHLGIDVDKLDEQSPPTDYPHKPEGEPNNSSSTSHSQNSSGEETPVAKVSTDGIPKEVIIETVKGSVVKALQELVEADGQLASVSEEQLQHDVSSTVKRDLYVEDHNIGTRYRSEDLKEEEKEKTKDMVPPLEGKSISEHRPPADQINGHNGSCAPRKQSLSRHSGAELSGSKPRQSPSSLEISVDDINISAKRPGQIYNNPSTPSSHTDVDQEDAPRSSTKNSFGRSGRRTPWTVPTSKPTVEPQDFEDPICDAFWKNIWCASAVHNTEIYRKVFHAVPDDHVATWKQYKEFVAYHDRLNKPVRDGSGPEPIARVPSESSYEVVGQSQESHQSDGPDIASQSSKNPTEDMPHTPLHASSISTGNQPEEPTNRARRPAKGHEPFEKWERDEMEKLLGELNGQLVTYPLHFLEGEDAANNFLFNSDRLLPLPIYN